MKNKAPKQIAAYVIGAPWPSNPDEICTYAVYGGCVMHGTIKEAYGTLEYVKSCVKRDREYDAKIGVSTEHRPNPEDYQIYQLVPINSAK